MAILVIPSFTLSIFWLDIPKIFHWIALVTGVLQLFILIYFVLIANKVIRAKQVRFHKSTSWLWASVAAAFCLKTALMFLSIFPYLSHFAFSYRPVIIGYLHLSFIGVTSLFILGYINEFVHRFKGRLSGLGALTFVIGFVGQELILMFQGLEAMNIRPVKMAGVLLFYCAALMVLGLMWMTYGIMRTKEE